VIALVSKYTKDAITLAALGVPVIQDRGMYHLRERKVSFLPPHTKERDLDQSKHEYVDITRTDLV